MQLFGLFGAGFIHLFNGLERKIDIAYFIGLAVPIQLNLTFFLKEQEAVFIGERLIRVQVTLDILFFLLGQIEVGLGRPLKIILALRVNLLLIM